MFYYNFILYSIFFRTILIQQITMLFYKYCLSRDMLKTLLTLVMINEK